MVTQNYFTPGVCSSQGAISDDEPRKGPGYEESIIENICTMAQPTPITKPIPKTQTLKPSPNPETLKPTPRPAPKPIL